MNRPILTPTWEAFDRPDADWCELSVEVFIKRHKLLQPFVTIYGWDAPVRRLDGLDALPATIVCPKCGACFVTAVPRDEALQSLKSGTVHEFEVELEGPDSNVLVIRQDAAFGGDEIPEIARAA